MSKRVTNAGTSWSGPLLTGWDTDDLWAQQDRWAAYAEGRVHIQGKPSVGPYAAPGTDRYRLMQLRCSHPGCGGLIGAVWCVLGEWEGHRFTWTETCEVQDRDARPDPVVRLQQMILDSITATFTVRSECFRHSWRAVPASELIALLPTAGKRMTTLGKSLSVELLGED